MHTYSGCHIRLAKEASSHPLDSHHIQSMMMSNGHGGVQRRGAPTARSFLRVLLRPEGVFKN
jgi:hypothetical protein